MKRNFIRLIASAMASCLLFFAFQANAQTAKSGLILRVTVNGVASDYYEGLCGYGTADWGGAVATNLCATPAWAHDITPDSLACDSIPAGQLTGKIALIRRGTCNFSDKALNAQKAGAVAVLVAQLVNAPTTDDCYVQNMGGVAPAAAQVTVPVLFICRNIANQITAAIAANQTVEVCMLRPDVDITSFFFPVSHISTPLTQIKTDTFGFGVNISNLKAVNLTNVKVTAKVLKSDDTELYSTTLTIPELDQSVVDSPFTVPGSFVPDLPLGAYKVTYSTTYDPIGAAPVQDRAKGDFYVTTNLFANDNGATIGFRPGTIAGDWGVGALYTIVPGTLEQYQTSTVSFAFAANATDYPLADVTASLSLFRITDDVDADFNGFDDTEFYSPSFEWLGLGSYDAPDGVVAYSLQNVTMGDIVTNGPIALTSGSRYVVAVQYPAPHNLTFNGFDEKVDLPGVSTLVFNGTWFLGGFGAGIESVIRMNIDLVSKTDEKPLPSNTMQIMPNPVVDNLNLVMQFEKPTDATITIADINGRVVTYENRKGLTNETLQYPLSLAAGTYLARIATNDGTLTKQFVVAK